MSELGAAYVSIIPSAKGFGAKLNSQVGGDLDSSGKTQGKRWGSAMKVGALAVLGGAAVLAKFLGGAVAEAREAQKVGAQTNAVIKSTGGAANITATQVGNLASAISKKSGIDDEAIQSASNLLLTFTNLRNETGKGNDVFNQATQAATDMGAALGTEPKAAAIQLGKALNDPIKGISALSRVGVSFTEGQKATIKKMVETGDILGAQKVILGELNKEFGGSAAAQATAADKAKVAWGNLKEQIGTQLLPVIDRLATFFTEKVAPAISTFVGQMKSGEGAGGTFANVLGKVSDVLGAVFGFLAKHKSTVLTFVGVLGAMTLAFALLNAVMAINPISLVILTVAALATGLIMAYKKSETFRTIVDGALRAVGAVFTWLWDNAARPVFRFIGQALDVAGRAFTWLWNNAARPALLFIGQALGVLMTIWGKMLQTLGNVPGFGWAKTAGDKMLGAANEALNLGDRIKKIPDDKKADVKAVVRGKGDVDALGTSVANLRDKTVTIRGQLAGSAAFNSALALGRNALGTNSWRGGPTWVGERGPEILNLPRGTSITSNREIRAMAGANSGAQNTFNVYETTSAGATARETARQLAFAGG